MRRLLLLGLTGFVLAAGPASAQDLPDTPSPDAHSEPISHPAISSDGTWTGAVAIGICFMFAAAAVIGPLTYSLAAQHMPELHDQEEHDPQHASQHEPGHGG